MAIPSLLDSQYRNTLRVCEEHDDRSRATASRPNAKSRRGRNEHGSGKRAGARLTLAAYPDPPLDFAQTQEVEALSRRWLSRLGGREPLLACAYFVLTKLDVTFGNRKNAALELNVSDAVLSKPGFLSSEHGDDSTARKARRTHKPQTPVAGNWVRKSVPELILRLARYSMGVTPPEPALGHLPMM